VFHDKQNIIFVVVAIYRGKEIIIMLKIKILDLRFSFTNPDVIFNNYLYNTMFKNSGCGSFCLPMTRF